MLKKVADLMIHRSEGKITKRPTMQNAVAIINIDEIHSKSRRIFMG